MAVLRLLVLAFLFAAPAAQAQDAHVPVGDACPAPISTCGSQTSFDTDRPDVHSLCPRGFECTCVPSCVGCKDCAAQVCVASTEPQCKTACDCTPGLGCFDGRCIAGIAPVYCCDADLCPAGQQCQHRDGKMDRCEREPDPMCRLRQQRSSQAVARVLERANRCNTDQDCVEIVPSTGCLGACPTYVNRRLRDGVEKRIERIDRKYCSDYQADGCPYATPGCLATEPRCVDRHCEAVPRLPGPPTPRPIERDVPLLQDQILDVAPRR